MLPCPRILDTTASGPLLVAGPLRTCRNMCKWPFVTFCRPRRCLFNTRSAFHGVPFFVVKTKPSIRFPMWVVTDMRSVPLDRDKKDSRSFY
jgi:hypothetical protein